MVCRFCGYEILDYTNFSAVKLPYARCMKCGKWQTEKENLREINVVHACGYEFVSEFPKSFAPMCPFCHEEINITLKPRKTNGLDRFIQ